MALLTFNLQWVDWCGLFGGYFVDQLWSIFGLYADKLRLFMDQFWSICGLSIPGPTVGWLVGKLYLWVVCGLFVDQMWYIYELAVDHMFICGVSVDYLWIVFLPSF